MICATTWLKALNIWTMVFLLGIVSTCTSGQSPCFGFGCKVSNISTSVWTYITTYIGMVRGTTNRDPIWKVSALWLSFKILQITLQKYKVWSINSRHMHLELELQEGSGTSDVMFFITTHRILYTYQAMGQSPFPGVRDVECRWSVEPSTDGTSAPNSAKTGGTRKCNMRPRRPLGSPSHSCLWRMRTSLRKWRCSNIWVSCCLMMTMIPRLCEGTWRKHTSAGVRFLVLWGQRMLHLRSVVYSNSTKQLYRQCSYLEVKRESCLPWA